MIFRLLLGAIIGGGILSWTGYKQMTLASKVETEPNPITLDDLIDNGSKNAHVQLSDFYGPGSFVYEGRGSGSGYAKVWIPVVGSSSAYMKDIEGQLLASGGNVASVQEPEVSGRDIQVIIVSSKCFDDGAVDALMMQDTMRGVITNDIESLDSDTRKYLREGFPGIDLNSVILVEANRDLPTTGGALGMLAGGLGLSGVGAAGAVVKGRRGKA